MARTVVVAFMVLLLGFNNHLVLADEGDDMNESEHSNHDDMSEMSESEHSNHGDNNDSIEIEKNDSTHSSDTDNHHQAVVETPPNFKVLGAFGAVNASFLIVGIWNKWIRRKGIR